MLLNWSPDQTCPFKLTASTEPAALAQGSSVVTLATARPKLAKKAMSAAARVAKTLGPLTNRVGIAAHNDRTY